MSVTRPVGFMHFYHGDSSSVWQVEHQLRLEYLAGTGMALSPGGEGGSSPGGEGGGLSLMIAVQEYTKEVHSSSSPRAGVLPGEWSFHLDTAEGHW